jgi:hypothetical protein
MARNPLVKVEVRTRFLPPLRFDVAAPGDESEPEAGGVGGWLLAQLRPAMCVETPFGSWSKAPYGEPGESRWPLAAAVAVVVLVAALLGVRHAMR